MSQPMSQDLAAVKPKPQTVTKYTVYATLSVHVGLLNNVAVSQASQLQGAPAVVHAKYRWDYNSTRLLQSFVLSLLMR